MYSTVSRHQWYEACREAADRLAGDIPTYYRPRTFSGIIGDIKALPARKALSLCTRKKGLGLQYAYQYLATGIDGGRGYQACASTALADMLKGSVRPELVEGCIPAKAGIQKTAQCAVPAIERLKQGIVLDVGCAIGVTAGILELERVVGFDLFIDLVRAAGLVDEIAGKRNRYVVADMLKNWPFGCVFDAVVCGLVCHHLKTQGEVAGFFSNANRVLNNDGLLVLTLPAGSIADAGMFQAILGGLATFGFDIVPEQTGMVASVDDPNSLFWMFQIVAEKHSMPKSAIFVDPAFSFKEIRTPVTRVEKADRARLTAVQTRRVIHDRFVLVSTEDLSKRAGDQPLTFETISGMVQD